MKRFLTLTHAMFMLHLRNRATLFWNMAFPILILVIYAVIFSTMTVGSQDYMTWVVPGVLVFNTLAYGLLGSSSIMAQMREKGVLRRLQASPVPAGQLVGSYLLVNLGIAIVQSILILAFSVLVFQSPILPVNMLRAFPMLVIAILTSVSLGQLISGVASSLGAVIAIGQVVNFSQMFISDLIMPIRMMPEWIQKVAPYLPANAMVNLVRPPLLDGQYSPDLLFHLAVAAVYTLVCGALAALLFRWQPRM